MAILATMADIRVVYRKFDGKLHWHLTMQYLGEDTHGVWTGMRAGGRIQRGEEPHITVGHAHVALLPRSGWWTAAFNDAPAELEIYCDITTEPTWSTAREVTMVDLDLDVARVRKDSSVHLLDEDEFAEHQIHYSYPQPVIDKAESAAAWLAKALADGSEPFATTYKYWLNQVK